MDKLTPDTNQTIKGPTAEMDDISDLPVEQWLDAVEDLGEDIGYFEPLGPDHSVMFGDRSPSLLVTFETYESITERSDTGLPIGHTLAQSHDWSHLTILAHAQDLKSHWFRSHFIYGYFDRLVEEGFFEDFDKVVFYGAGASGYAASAYSVAAPGATVIAIAPQATLDARLASWDKRFDGLRRMDFSTRYGFAPDMVDAADNVWVLYDPTVPDDAMHAALFNRPHTTLRPIRNFGTDPEFELLEMKAIEPIVKAAMSDGLTQRKLTQALRNRREHGGYLRRLLTEVTSKKRPQLTIQLCEHALKSRNGWRFRKALKAARQNLSDKADTAD
ncbi:hypothetical protein EDD53_0251 [Pacificibacter maritimus]|uniref:Phosphoadenosine phosphosulfate reductase n=1 Tax=Pacificibacter maritimus TaxID=762213 RepID=A0A3N4UMA4_9RHOB|nr:phosphoadenosine phosphosulfate reductase [Pacificibacter maritimus]RPE71138.1 hypothetical protein EDD53_0251 [Pacificibacter maritimus]